VNATVAQLTVRTILGRRRALLLLALPVVLLVLSLIVRATVDADSREDVTIGLLGTFALATLIPLLGLIAGTGAIGPEIDDGSIVYLLAKPVNRHSIVVSKLLVAIAVVSTFGAIPVFVSGLVLAGTTDRLWLASGHSSPAWPTARCSCCSRFSPATRSSSA
jgi:ABC-2 type transport system permease protein